MVTFPIIRLEVEGMKYQIMTALTGHAAQMDEDIKTAVDQYCTPENMSRIVKKAASDALDFAIKTEVDAFFRYGGGRKAVAAAVKESILKNETYTVIDNLTDEKKA